MHPLDAPVWFSLQSASAALVTGDGSASCYPPDVTAFAGYDPATDGRTLASIVGADRVALLVGQAAPPGVVELGGGEGYQLVLDHVPERDAPDAMVELGDRDYTEMAALVGRAQPGPWAPRTPVLGTYLGVRRNGVLVAMAGERLKPAGYTEISAVCTDESSRRQGLASALCAELARRIIDRGDTPFLHVATSNIAALPVYEQLGFAHRRRISFTAIRLDAQAATPARVR